VLKCPALAARDNCMSLDLSNGFSSMRPNSRNVHITATSPEAGDVQWPPAQLAHALRSAASLPPHSRSTRSARGLRFGI